MKRRFLTISDMEYCRPCENPTLLVFSGRIRDRQSIRVIQALVALVLLVLGAVSADPFQQHAIGYSRALYIAPGFSTVEI